MGYNQKKKRGALEDFITGGNLVFNRFLFLANNALHISLVAGTVFSILFVTLVHFFTNAYQWYAFKRLAIAYFWKTIFLPGFPMNFTMPDGHPMHSKAWELVDLFSRNQELHHYVMKIDFLAVISFLFAGSLVPAAIYLYREIGEKALEDDFLGGQEIVSAEDLAASIKDPSPIKIGEVPIPKPMLARNLIAVGNMGTGKSQLISHLIFDVRKWGKKMVIYDPSGEFTSRFFRDGIDIILNPLDARCADWSIFADVKEITDPALVSRFFVPENKKSSDPIWDNAARMLFEDLLNIVHSRGGTMADLRRMITRVSLEDLFKILSDNDASSVGVINPKNERGSESVRLTLTSQPAVRFFDFFNNRSAAFSVREFMNRDDDACLFLTSSAVQHEMIRPFLSIWISLALAELMRAEPLHDNIRAFFILDELASLGKMDSLETALTQARKYGIVTVGGIQNLSQLDEIFGEHLTKAYVSNYGTKYILRVEEESSAKRLSQTLGEEDIDEKSESESFGATEGKDGLNLGSKREDRALVKYSTIMRLPDLTGFLKVAGNHPVAQVSIKFKKWDSIVPGYIPRDGLDLAPYGSKSDSDQLNVNGMGSVRDNDNAPASDEIADPGDRKDQGYDHLY